MGIFKAVTAWRLATTYVKTDTRARTRARVGSIAQDAYIRVARGGARVSEASGGGGVEVTSA